MKYLRLKRHFLSRQGFSLIELLVTFTILSVFLAVLIRLFSQYSLHHKRTEERFYDLIRFQNFILTDYLPEDAQSIAKDSFGFEVSARTDYGVFRKYFLSRQKQTKGFYIDVFKPKQ